MIRSSLIKTNRCFSTLNSPQTSFYHLNSLVDQNILFHQKETNQQVSRVHLTASFTQFPLLPRHQLLCLRSLVPMTGGKKNMTGAKSSKSDSPISDKTEASSTQNNAAKKKEPASLTTQDNTKRGEESSSKNTGARKKTQANDVSKDTAPRDGNPPIGGSPPTVDRSSPPKGKTDNQTDAFSDSFRSSSFSSEDSHRSHHQSGPDRLDGPLESDKIPQLKKYVSEGPTVSLPMRTTFEEDWKRLHAMTLEEKRKLYSCRKFNTLQDIPTWTQYAKDNAVLLSRHRPHRKLFTNDREYEFSANLNEKVSIFIGDITSLEIDCIVNAANSSLLGGGGVDGAIHRAAGPSLLKECKTLGGCKTGEAKLSRGYKMPCNFIIHTVGPMDSNDADLYSSYFNSLQLAFLKKIRTIAFPCISTGIYGFPNEQAVSIVLPIIRKILNRNPKQFDRIIFCLFMQQDIELYLKYMQVFFPIQAPGAAAS